MDDIISMSSDPRHQAVALAMDPAMISDNFEALGDLGMMQQQFHVPQN